MLPLIALIAGALALSELVIFHKLAALNVADVAAVHCEPEKGGPGGKVPIHCLVGEPG